MESCASLWTVTQGLTCWENRVNLVTCSPQDHMATRSRIGIELADGSILSAYHHWDGYPEWLGRILKTHYNTREKAADLINGGDMSSCWTKDRWTGKEIAPRVIEQQEAEEYGPQYYADRGDRECEPELDSDLNEYLNYGEEYAYVFRNGEWVCYDMRHFKKPTLVKIPAGALAV